MLFLFKITFHWKDSSHFLIFFLNLLKRTFWHNYCYLEISCFQRGFKFEKRKKSSRDNYRWGAVEIYFFAEFFGLSLKI